MKRNTLFSHTGYLLYLHILPRNFGHNFVAEFGPGVFTFVLNCHHKLPHPGDTIPFGRCGSLREARVVSVVETSMWDKQRKLTNHDFTVNAHPSDLTIIDIKTMNLLLYTRGWKFLTTEGTVHSVH